MDKGNENDPEPCEVCGDPSGCLERCETRDRWEAEWEAEAYAKWERDEEIRREMYGDPWAPR